MNISGWSRKMIRSFGLILTLPCCFSLNPSVLLGTPRASKQPLSSAAKNSTHIQKLPNGIELRNGRNILQVLALRDDVLRIRESLTGELPEDASWAVPESIRRQTVTVTQDSGDSTGFHTASLRVHIEPATFALSITDLEGHVLQEDDAAWPIESHGERFRVYKKMPADEHYFGLGDKAGPLDRRGQSFRLWNTDSFGFQESTDPIYKSIPFFLAMRAGRSIGFLPPLRSRRAP